MEQQVYTTIRTGREFVSQEGRVAEIGASDVPSGAFYLGAKRVLDLLGSFFGLLLLFPLFAVLALLIRRDSPGPVTHRRRVLGKQDYQGGDPETFDAFKFRTMIVDADEYLRRNPHLMNAFQKDFKLRDDPRVTRLGNKLRTTSLDELPQLINVLRGQMSLVGPRMISPPELEMYGEHAAKLLSVKPGMTGLWQVSGRQHISYQERVRLDMWYIENRSLLLDLQILLRTIKCVLQRQGAF
jgi:lipopolysaccharide/colanic/teichoic acid biosynthesis glycosyltransferase